LKFNDFYKLFIFCIISFSSLMTMDINGPLCLNGEVISGEKLEDISRHPLSSEEYHPKKISTNCGRFGLMVHRGLHEENSSSVGICKKDGEKWESIYNLEYGETSWVVLWAEFTEDDSEIKIYLKSKNPKTPNHFSVDSYLCNFTLKIKKIEKSNLAFSRP
jgi:hypothetical protein